MPAKKAFWGHLALFLSGAMFWGAITHIYLALKKIETTTFGIRIEADENWWGAAFHIALAFILFWLYKRNPGKINNN